MPEWIDDVVQHLLASLGDRDTVVRWSAAKGLGRLCARLPPAFAAQVRDALLTPFLQERAQQPPSPAATPSDPTLPMVPPTTAFSPYAWHGTCLAVAEMTRRGLVPRRLLPHMTPWIIAALHYEPSHSHALALAHTYASLRTASTSGASYVRDAAAYVLWALARSFTPRRVDAPSPADAAVTPAVPQALLVAALLDRDVTCRRAAAAAYQELVGRWGTRAVPHGIALLAHVHYFSVGALASTYGDVLAAVACYDVYRAPLVHALWTRKCVHWDVAVRRLAAGALARLARSYPRWTGWYTAVLPALVR